MIYQTLVPTWLHFGVKIPPRLLQDASKAQHGSPCGPRELRPLGPWHHPLARITRAPVRIWKHSGPARKNLGAHGPGGPRGRGPPMGPRGPGSYFLEFWGAPHGSWGFGGEHLSLCWVPMGPYRGPLKPMATPKTGGQAWHLD